MRRGVRWTREARGCSVPKQQTLANVHQILLGAIQVMQTVEHCVSLGGPVPDPIFEAPVQPWLRSDSEIVHASYSRRSSSKNLSALGVTASESVDKYESRPSLCRTNQTSIANLMAVRHLQVPSAELPGSTPDDLLSSNTRDPPRYARTQRSQSYNPTRVNSPTSAHAPFCQVNNLTQSEHRTAQHDTSHMSILDPETTYRM